MTGFRSVLTGFSRKSRWYIAPPPPNALLYIVGRFLEPDSIGYDGGLNLYAYVGGDPINNVDPLGTAKCGRRIRGAECEKVLDNADEARKKAQKISDLLRNISEKIRDGEDLTDDEQGTVELIRKRFGKKAASQGALSNISSVLRNISGRIGEREKGVTITKGNNINLSVRAYVRPGKRYFGIIDGDNTIYVNSPFLRDRNGHARSATIIHEAAHLEGVMLDFYKAPGIRRLLSSGRYNVLDNADTFSCMIYGDVCGY